MTLPTSWGEDLDSDAPLPEHPTAAARAAGVAQPQRPLGVRVHAVRGIRPARRRRPARARPAVFDHEIVVPFSPETTPVGRRPRHRAGRDALVPPAVHGPRRCRGRRTGAAALRRGRPVLPRRRRRRRGRRPHRRIPALHARHHRRARRRRRPRTRRRRAGCDATPPGSPAASRRATAAASGTRRSPESGRPCGSRCCRASRSIASCSCPDLDAGDRRGDGRERARAPATRPRRSS